MTSKITWENKLAACARKEHDYITGLSYVSVRPPPLVIL